MVDVETKHKNSVFVRLNQVMIYGSTLETFRHQFTHVSLKPSDLI